MDDLINRLNQLVPDVNFISGKQFSWSSELREITYIDETSSEQDTWALLHESGHALLGHNSYKGDFELLALEVKAWQEAKQLGSALDIEIDEDHIQDCLDTYRDWLHDRSICPTCGNQSLQQDDLNSYQCFNCQSAWVVSTNRFCRTYRKNKGISKTNLAVA